MLCLPLFVDEDPPPPMVIQRFFLAFLATCGGRLADTSVSVRLPRSASLLLTPPPPEGLVLQHSEAVSPANSPSEWGSVGLRSAGMLSALLDRCLYSPLPPLRILRRNEGFFSAFTVEFLALGILEGFSCSCGLSFSLAAGVSICFGLVTGILEAFLRAAASASSRCFCCFFSASCSSFSFSAALLASSLARCFSSSLALRSSSLAFSRATLSSSLALFSSSFALFSSSFFRLASAFASSSSRFLASAAAFLSSAAARRHSSYPLSSICVNFNMFFLRHTLFSQ